MYETRILGRKIRVRFSSFRNRFSCGVDGVLISEAKNAKEAVREILAHITVGHYGRDMHFELPAILWEKLENLKEKERV